MNDAENQVLSADELERLVRYHNDRYFRLQRPEISDYEFDQLTRRLRKLRPDSPALGELSEGALGERVAHKEPMLSLDKCYEQEELERWAQGIAGDFLIMPKIDGVACSLVYTEGGRLRCAATRGDGRAGEDITANAVRLDDVPKRIETGGREVEVRGEVYMRLSDFASYRAQFANPRNLAAGAVKMKELPEGRLYPLHFFAYDVLGPRFETEEEKLRFLEGQRFVPAEWEVQPREALQAAYQAHREGRGARDYEVDGVVYRANRVSERERLGSTAHHPRYAIAYKFQGEDASTVLRAIEWQVSRTGAITPVGIIEPVQLSGATVSRCSLHNAGMLAKLGVSPEARVVVMRRGGVIPNLEQVLEPGPGKAEVPAECPSCHRPTELRGDFLFCADPDHCPGAVIGRFEHYLAVLEVDGFGRKILDSLFRAGLLRDLPDLYQLTPEAMQGIERMGKVLAEKLVANLNAAREVPLPVFLRALGIDELGRHMAEILAQWKSLGRVLAVTPEELAGRHGVGELTARAAVLGLSRKRPLIDALLQRVRIADGAERDHAGSPFAGKSVVFTGKLESLDRRHAQKLVASLGGTTPSGVTRDLCILVVGGDELAGKPTGKRAKAERYNADGGQIAIVDEKQFLAWVEEGKAALKG